MWRKYSCLPLPREKKSLPRHDIAWEPTWAEKSIIPRVRAGKFNYSHPKGKYEVTGGSLTNTPASKRTEVSGSLVQGNPTIRAKSECVHCVRVLLLPDCSYPPAGPFLSGVKWCKATLDSSGLMWPGCSSNTREHMIRNSLHASGEPLRHCGRAKLTSLPLAISMGKDGTGKGSGGEGQDTVEVQFCRSSMASESLIELVNKVSWVVHAARFPD